MTQMSELAWLAKGGISTLCLGPMDLTALQNLGQVFFLGQVLRCQTLTAPAGFKPPREYSEVTPGDPKLPIILLPVRMTSLEHMPSLCGAGPSSQYLVQNSRQMLVSDLVPN